MPQFFIAAGFGIGTLTLVAFFAWVARSTRREALAYEQIARSVGRLQRVWFITLSGVVAGAIALTLSQLPYPTYRLGTLSLEPAPIPVNVTAYQYRWDLNQRVFDVGDIVQFDVLSGDVNHGFAIYDPQNRLVGQVQAMPGQTNTLVMHFEQSGTYLIRCLELCGTAHHGMAHSLCVGASCAMS